MTIRPSKYFLVSVVVLVEDVNRVRRSAWVWETMYLVMETTHSKARAKGLRVAQADNPKSILPIKYRGMVVRLRVLGVRRSVECRDTFSSSVRGVVDALDLGYTTLRFDSKQAAVRFARGGSARVTIID
jgi:hypothetical protein